MTRFLALLVIALITFGIVILVKRPELINNIWLWMIGFAGVIVRLFQGIQHSASRFFSKGKELYVEEKNKLTGKNT